MAPEETPAFRVFVVTNVPFWIQQRGSSRRIEAMLEYLKSFCEVTVCFVGELKIRDWNEARSRLDFELIGPGIPGRVASAIVNQFAPLLPAASPDSTDNETQPVRLGDFRSERIADFVGQEVARRNSQVVILEYVTMAYLCDTLRRLPDPPLLMIDTHDLMHVRSAELSKFGIENWLMATPLEELNALGKSDVVLAIQEQEAKRLADDLPPSCRVCLVKHAVEFKPMDSTRRKIGGNQANRPLIVGFLGSSGKANSISLSNFIEHSWPKILAALGDRIQLKIGGSIRPEDLVGRIASLAQIQFLGRVEKVADFYSEIDVAINPALIQSGLKIKSLECLAHSVPLITTPAGIAGLENSIGFCAQVAQDPDQYAHYLVQFVEDPRLLETFRNHCRLLIESEFSAASVYSELKRAIEQSGSPEC